MVYKTQAIIKTDIERMAKVKKFKRKDLKLKEDPFQEFIKETIAYIRDNYEKIIAAIVGIVIIIGGIYAWKNVREKRKLESGTAFTQAWNYYQKGISAPPNQDPEKIPSVQERVENLREAERLFNDVWVNYRKSAYAEESLYYRSVALFYAGDKAEAINAINEYMVNYPKGLFAPSAKLNLAYINERDNKRIAAIDLIREIIVDFPNRPIIPQAKMAFARLLTEEGDAQITAGNTGVAVARFQEAKEAYGAVIALGEENPYYADAKQNLEDVVERLNEYAEETTTAKADK